jgi:REP element-mobilizing transposase RayT
LPRAVIEHWIADRNLWLVKHGITFVGVPGSVKNPNIASLIPERLRSEYSAFVAERWEQHLDECHGECLLKRPELAQIVADSLLHFDGERYAMGDFVVMPNHVHLLVCFPNEDQLLSQCYSWKKFTATQINKRIGRRGEFWQFESFDHLVRSPDEFERYRKYIADNPGRAKLPAGSFYYYRATVRRSACSPGTP